MEKFAEFPIKNSSAIVIAGGMSRRMNADKRFLKVRDTILLRKVVSQVEKLFSEVLVSTSFNSKLTLDSYCIVNDILPDRGPLTGILSGLEKSSFETNFIIASDIPEISREFVMRMYEHTGEYEIVVPVSGTGKFEPLFAFYNKKIITVIKSMLDQGQNRIINIFGKVNTKYIKMKNNDWYFNLNTMKDYRNYLKYLEK